MKLILNSKSPSLLFKTLNELIKSKQFEQENVYKFDWEVMDVSELETILFTTDIFNSHKVIVIKNFNWKKLQNLNKKELIYFEKLFSKEIQNTLIILTSIDNFKKNKFYEMFFETYKLIELTVPIKNDLILFIKNWFSKNNIIASEKEIKLLVKKTNSNFDLIINELNKIKSLELNEISINDINEIVYDFNGESIFNFTNSFLKKESKQDVLNNLNKLLQNGNSIYLILSRLIEDIIFISLIKDVQYNEMILLQLNEFRLKKMQEISKFWENEDILNLLENLLKLKIDLQKQSFDSEKEEMFKIKIYSLI